MATALKELEDVSECSICTEVFTDPRVLPCVHTYCLKCIQGLCKDKHPGEKICCPLCRQESTIPEDGLGGLPKNFFVEKVLRIKDLTKVKEKYIPCDMCTYRAESGPENINSGTVYCLQCQENFCKPCASGHRQQKATRDHKLVNRGGEIRAEDLYAEYPPANCDKHVSETMKLYCNDCKLVICAMCFAIGHNTHKCSDVNEVVDEFRKQMTDDVTSVLGGVEQCEDMLRKLNTEKKNLQEQVSKSEREIREKTKQLKLMLDRHEELLLAELKSIREKRIRELEAACEEVQRQLAAMENYDKYVYEIKEKGTACDIARAASGLHHRAAELVVFDVLERTMSDLGRTCVTFSPANFITDDFSKTIGGLQLDYRTFGEMMTRSSVSVTNVKPEETGVSAVTSVGDHVYLVRGGKKEVEVYDVETLKLQRRLRVPGLSRDASGIAACARNKCVYLSDWNNPSVHRVNLAIDRVKQWRVAKKPEGLSVNAASNVLVACLTDNKIQEYAFDGKLLREVVVERPWHAIQLSSGQYVVSQHTTPGVVSMVGGDGQVVRSYRPTQASDFGPMKWPRSLAVTEQGYILVADEDNNRILAIDPLFGRAQELPVPSEIQLQQPFALFLDEPRDRLYVGEWWGSDRLTVLCGVRNIC